MQDTHGSAQLMAHVMTEVMNLAKDKYNLQLGENNDSHFICCFSPIIMFVTVRTILKKQIIFIVVLQLYFFIFNYYHSLYSKNKYHSAYDDSLLLYLNPEVSNSSDDLLFNNESKRYSMLLEIEN